MGDAAATLRRIARELETFPRAFIGDAVGKLRKSVSKRLAGDTGGDRRLSHAGNVELRVKSSIADGGDVVTGEVHAGSPRSQWTWLEEGTQPHGGHPGTRALHTWSDATSPILDDLADDARVRWSRIIQG
jgi:hypothetical protein